MTTTTQRDLTDEIAATREQNESGYVSLDRNKTIKAIRAALKRRTGKTWSVTGGRGTAWGWIHIDAPPARRTGKRIKNPDYVDDGTWGNPRNPEFILVDTGEKQEFGYMTPGDNEILRKALGLERVSDQGVSIPSGGDYYEEYIARAEGRKPMRYGRQYWD